MACGRRGSLVAMKETLFVYEMTSVLDFIPPLCNSTFTSGHTIEIMEISVRFKIERTCGTDPQQNPLTNARFGKTVDFNSFKHSLQIWVAPTKNPGCSRVETTSTGKSRTNKIQNGDMTSSTDDFRSGVKKCMVLMPSSKAHTAHVKKKQVSRIRS